MNKKQRDKTKRMQLDKLRDECNLAIATYGANRFVNATLYTLDHIDLLERKLAKLRKLLLEQE